MRMKINRIFLNILLALLIGALNVDVGSLHFQAGGDEDGFCCCISDCTCTGTCCSHGKSEGKSEDLKAPAIPPDGTPSWRLPTTCGESQSEIKIAFNQQKSALLRTHVRRIESVDIRRFKLSSFAMAPWSPCCLSSISPRAPPALPLSRQEQSRV